MLCRRPVSRSRPTTTWGADVYALMFLPVLICLLTWALIQVKHLIVDWMWQPPYEFMNKGTYGHWGGIRHALKNAIGTGLCLYLGFLGMLSPEKAFALGCLDFVIHYHVDWTKMNLNRHCHLCPQTEKFWWLLGADQFAHQMTYLVLVALGFAFLFWF